jgi:hypothetical protein
MPPLDPPFVVRIEKKPEGSFGGTMNSIRSCWIITRSNQRHSNPLRATEAVLDLRSASPMRRRHTASSAILRDLDRVCLSRGFPVGASIQGRDLDRFQGPLLIHRIPARPAIY